MRDWTIEARFALYLNKMHGKTLVVTKHEAIIINISKNVRLVDGIIRILKRKDQIIIGPNR